MCCACKQRSLSLVLRKLSFGCGCVLTLFMVQSNTFHYCVPRDSSLGKARIHASNEKICLWKACLAVQWEQMSLNVLLHCACSQIALCSLKAVKYLQNEYNPSAPHIKSTCPEGGCANDGRKKTQNVSLFAQSDFGNKSVTKETVLPDPSKLLLNEFDRLITLSLTQ